MHLYKLLSIKFDTKIVKATCKVYNYTKNQKFIIRQTFKSIFKGNANKQVKTMNNFNYMQLIMMMII